MIHDANRADPWRGLRWGALGGTVLAGAAALPLIVAARFTDSFTARPQDTLASGFHFLIGVPLWQFLICVALATVAAAMLVWGMRGYLDPEGRARAALRWTWRAPMSWLLVVGFSVLTGIVEQHGNLAFIIVFLACFVAPFLLWNTEVAGSETFAFPLQPRWPGWQAVGASVLLLLASHLLDAALPLLLGIAADEMELAAEAGWLAGEVVSWPVSFLLWLGVAALFLDRTRSPGRSLATAWRWSQARPAFWLASGVGVGGAVLLGALLFQTMFAIYLAPQIDLTARASGQRVPWLVDVLARAPSFLGAAALPLLLFESAALGRLLWLQREAEAKPQRSSHPSASN